MRDWYEPPTNGHSFNRFFSRYPRSLEVQSFAALDDPRVVNAPADSVPQGVWSINDQSCTQVDDRLRVKLARFYGIPELLDSDSAYVDAFAGGVLTHAFLNISTRGRAAPAHR